MLPPIIRQDGLLYTTNEDTIKHITILGTEEEALIETTVIGMKIGVTDTPLGIRITTDPTIGIVKVEVGAALGRVLVLAVVIAVAVGLIAEHGTTARVRQALQIVDADQDSRIQAEAGIEVGTEA